MAKPHPDTILAALRRSWRPFDSDAASFSINPGIYAVFFAGTKFPGCDGVTTGDLIYIGKTESSQVSRDLNTHFADGRTGSSTLRRTLGALLRNELGLKPQPRSASEKSEKRFKNYRFDPEGERALTAWMRKNLGLSFFEMPTGIRAEIKQIERALISLACPILNLAENGANAQGNVVRAARKVCAELARAAGGGESSPTEAVRKSKAKVRTGNRENSPMFLHDAIAKVLRERLSQTATAQEISREIEQRGLYQQKAGDPAPASQILLRARKRPNLFDLLSSQRVRLR